MSVNLIVAVDKYFGIAKDGNIPWYLPEDLKYFKDITTNYGDKSSKNVVVMGRKTWDTIPEKFRPLKGRINCILTKNQELISSDILMHYQNADQFNEGPHYFFSIDQLLVKFRNNNIFIIGGKQIYEYILTKYKDRINKIFLTFIKKDFDCDLYLHYIDTNFKLISCDKKSKIITFNEKETKLNYEFLVYEKRPKLDFSEQFYLNKCDDILELGIECNDRTGIGIKIIFGNQFRYNLQDSFPLLTTKQMYWKGIVEELLWFLKGDTNSKHLEEKKVFIWKGNTTREFLDKRGLTDLQEGDIGAGYGFQFRHFGADYEGCDVDYTGKGYDQVKEVLRQIREEPESRRIVLSLWNPNFLDKMCLPPCHILYQFRVLNGKLYCSMYQRSGDMGLGIPFNIASASLMTHIFAKLSGLRVGEFIHTVADAHLYKNHFEGVSEQTGRTPRPYPKLVIKDRGQSQVEDFEYSDFVLEGYTPYPSIKMEMAV